MKKINSRLGDKIDITDIKAEYDKNVKLLLSEKIILAHILVYAVKEYKGMNPVDVIELINGDPDKGRYDLMSIIMVRLSKELAEATDETKLHRLLGTLLSNQMTRSEKKTIIETEYEIPITHEIERRVNQMCNLSDSIEEKGIEKGKELGKSEGIRVLVESCQDFGKTKEETMAHVAQKYEIAIEKVKEYIDMYWK